MAENSSGTLPGTVEKIITSSHPGVPDKAQIAVARADDLYQEIRFENTLTDENGDKVGLKKGAEVGNDAGRSQVIAPPRQRTCK